MSSKALFPLIAAILAVAFSPAEAKTRITTVEKTYTISGKTGIELLQQMNRKGPKHGFMARAMAQTWYSPKPSGTLKQSKGVCRIDKPGITMEIRYTYPKPAGRLDPAMQARWDRFLASVRKHEREHGRMATAMAGEMDQAMRSFAVKDKPGCRRSVAMLTRDLKKIWDKWDARQDAFDRAEHKNHGPVEKIVIQLVKK